MDSELTTFATKSNLWSCWFSFLKIIVWSPRFLSPNSGDTLPCMFFVSLLQQNGVWLCTRCSFCSVSRPGTFALRLYVEEENSSLDWVCTNVQPWLSANVSGLHIDLKPPSQLADSPGPTTTYIMSDTQHLKSEWPTSPSWDEPHGSKRTTLTDGTAGKKEHSILRGSC